MYQAATTATEVRAAAAIVPAASSDTSQPAPYPPSPVIPGITWHWDTHRTAALGSDLWPVTWGLDDSLYTAWGDGGGFGGSDSDGRVSMGFARIDGPPEAFTGANINGGKNPEHPASFPAMGKTGGILMVGRRLYAWLNLQDGEWPDVDFGLIWSDNRGATWKMAPWLFFKGAGRFHPGTFLNFGKGYTGLPRKLQGYVYFYGVRQGDDSHTYLGRVARDRVRNRNSYRFFRGVGPDNQPLWGADLDPLHPVFNCLRGGEVTVSYVPALQRYLLTSFHSGPGQLGLFDAPQPWGPWTTVGFYDHWGDMGPEGEGLTCTFPQKWISADGRTLWCVFSVYGSGARMGINAHDRFNLVKATLQLADAPGR